MGRKENRAQYNFFCAPSGKDLICKFTKDDKVIQRIQDRSLYGNLGDIPIKCEQTKEHGFNCKVE